MARRRALDSGTTSDSEEGSESSSDSGGIASSVASGIQRARDRAAEFVDTGSSSSSSTETTESSSVGQISGTQGFERAVQRQTGRDVSAPTPEPSNETRDTSQSVGTVVGAVTGSKAAEQSAREGVEEANRQARKTAQQQGIEASDSQVGRQASELEEQVVSQSSVIDDPSQVSVTQQGDTLSANINEVGEFRLRESVAEQNDGLDASQVNLQESDGRYRAVVTDQGVEDVIRQQATSQNEDAGPGDVRVDVTQQPGARVAGPDQDVAPGALGDAFAQRERQIDATFTEAFAREQIVEQIQSQTERDIDPSAVSVTRTEDGGFRGEYDPSQDIGLNDASDAVDELGQAAVGDTRDVGTRSTRAPASLQRGPQVAGSDTSLTNDAPTVQNLFTGAVENLDTERAKQVATAAAPVAAAEPTPFGEIGTAAATGAALLGGGALLANSGELSIPETQQRSELEPTAPIFTDAELAIGSTVATSELEATAGGPTTTTVELGQRSVSEVEAPTAATSATIADSPTGTVLDQPTQPSIEQDEVTEPEVNQERNYEFVRERELNQGVIGSEVTQPESDLPSQDELADGVGTGLGTIIGSTVGTQAAETASVSAGGPSVSEELGLGVGVASPTEQFFGSGPADLEETVGLNQSAFDSPTATLAPVGNESTTFPDQFNFGNEVGNANLDGFETFFGGSSGGSGSSRTPGGGLPPFPGGSGGSGGFDFGLSEDELFDSGIADANDILGEGDESDGESDGFGLL